jgi:integrase
MRSPSQRWRERGSRRVRLALPFDDIMEIALALLALSPAELEALGWSFADRKRLLDHFLASGKAAQRTDRAMLGETRLELRLPLRDVRRLQMFVRRDLPKAASNAAILNRLGATLDTFS